MTNSIATSFAEVLELAAMMVFTSRKVKIVKKNRMPSLCRFWRRGIVADLGVERELKITAETTTTSKNTWWEFQSRKGINAAPNRKLTGDPQRGVQTGFEAVDIHISTTGDH